MSETVARHRPSVDLDDFERRMRQSARPQDHHQGSFEDDPLTELARLVGEQPDPYGDVFAREAMSPPRQADQDRFAPPPRREPGFGRGLDFASIEAGLRGSLPAHPDPSARHDLSAHESHQGYAEPTFEQDPYAEQPQAWQQAQAQAKSRAPIYAMVATIAVGVIGIGVAFAFKGASSSPREIRTIVAAAGPTKIQPPADASADDASQNGTAQGTPTKLASREEQPVDLSQAVQDNASRDAASQQTGDQGAASVPVPLSPGQAGDTTASPDYSTLGGTSNAATQTRPAADGSQAFGAGMPAPKKVKVVSVRPDGTIVSNDAAVPPVDAAPPSVAPQIAGLASEDTPKVADKPVKKSSKTTSRVTSKPMDIASAANDTDTPATPKPAKPAKKAKPTQVATADTGEQAPAETAAPKGSGGFAVQFAAPTTEAEAKAASAKFGKKFADALSGHRLSFHKADSNGHSVFRVRSSGLTKDEAEGLCEKVKAGGGSCFVARG